jgi:hypothetical protein
MIIHLCSIQPHLLKRHERSKVLFLVNTNKDASAYGDLDYRRDVRAWVLNTRMDAVYGQTGLTTSQVHLVSNLRLHVCRIPLGCETWSLTLREERRLKVFENRVLRKVFGPKRDEVTGNGESCITRR